MFYKKYSNTLVSAMEPGIGTGFEMVRNLLQVLTFISTNEYDV